LCVFGKAAQQHTHNIRRVSIVSDRRGKKEGTHLEAVVCPTAKLHDTRLLVKREVLDVDLARALVNSGWLPLDSARIVEGGFCGQGHFKVAVRAAKEIAKDAIQEMLWRWSPKKD
jgi:hypothetical protein